MHATLKVNGMTCGNCVKHVTKAASKVAGVSEPKVDLATGRVDLEYDPQQAPIDAIAAAISKAGYPAEVLG
jgi:copper chaperone CopZ